MLVHGVQPEELPAVFPAAAEFILKIPRLPERFRLKDVYEEVETGNWQMWIMFEEKIEGVLLTTVTQYPLRRELHMIGVSGTRMREWVNLIDTIEKYGVQNDCESSLMLGVRRGFGRLLPEYKGNRLILEKVL